MANIADEVYRQNQADQQHDGPVCTFSQVLSTVSSLNTGKDAIADTSQVQLAGVFLNVSEALKKPRAGLIRRT